SSAVALRAQAARLRAWVSSVDAGSVELADVGWSLVTGRAELGSRAVVVAQDVEGFLTGLEALVEDRPAAGVVQGRVTTGKSAWLFTGQGSQRVGMGRDLYARFPVFAQVFDAVCVVADPLLGCSLKDVVFEGAGEPGLLDRTDFTQPALFAVEVALARLLESFGVRPDFVAGHSVGELAAAHVAGVFSLEDAVVLVCARGRLMQALPTGGAMVSLQATETEVLEQLIGCEDRVTVAAVNGPRSVVVSGDEEVVTPIMEYFEGQGRRVKRLRVSHAFHSPRMDAMLEDFGAVASDVVFQAPVIPLVSNVTGTQIDSERVCSPQYWVEQVRAAVRFRDGVADLVGRGVTRFVEVGPDAILSAAVEDCLDEDEFLDESASVVVIASQRRDREQAAVFVQA
ncbi:acyltransferase domain-containing protein, partial [Nocardia salmonicida]|uniref:acyltransferase domain-containing protein n=1 Tax=Nocardia salmonicida TaxID=53431 RepID=UPI000A55462F